MAFSRIYLVFCILIISGSLSTRAQVYFHEETDTLRNTGHGNNFYDTGKNSPKWIRSLRNVIIVPPKVESEADTFNIQQPANLTLGMQGRTISQIRVIRLKPFGSSINDTTAQELSWLGQVGNATHVTTREFIIRNTLLFHEGDTINNLKIADSERLLRSLRYIDDARIVANPLPDGKAEIIIITQDILPYAVGFGTNFSSNANLSVSNRNIIGLGFEMRAETFINSKKDNLMGYAASMRVPNIWRSHVSFEADFLDKYETKRFGLMLNREFYSTTTKYAGNLTLYQAQIGVKYYDPDPSYVPINPVLVRFNHFDSWVGRSFQLGKASFNKLRDNFTISVRAQKTDFLQRPDNAANLYYQFQNRTVYLSSLTFSRQAYYKTNLIYNFGRTEDIPYGYSASIVGGKELNELYDRPYVGANVSAGYFVPKLGYLSGMASFGTFFRNGTEQGSLNIALNYFTNLYVIGKFRQRTFANIQYTRQLNNKLNDYLDIDGDAGIPGFRNDSVLGRHRFNLSLEQDLFTPWYFYGFRFVLYAFADFSWLGDYEKPIIGSTLYSSFGIGCRIRNNRLIINTIQLRLAYFPNIPDNSRFRYIELSKETVLEPRNFSPKAPEIVPLY